MPTFQNYLKGIKNEIKEIDAAGMKEVLDKGDSHVAVIDVREKDEYVQGYIPGATWIPRGFLELRIEEAVPERDQPVVLYCAGGTRSALAARALHELGYTDVTSMAGGFTSWKRNGNRFEMPVVMTPEQEMRYARHTMLPEVGVKGQVKLLESKVLCLGAGGLGSPSALYLAAAGVGTIGIVDDDVVDASNLQRQILHATDRVGMSKVDSAEKTLNGLNPDVQIKKFQERLTSDNVLEIIKDFDVIVDGADNFQTRYLLNDAALKLGKHVVHSSIYRFEGQLTVFTGDGHPCYRCLYPEPPPPEEAPSCQEAGVLGVLPGIMGVLQATEAVKLILGIGTSLSGRLLVFDALKTKFRELKLRQDPNCPTCGEGVDRSQIELIDYVQFCAGA
ncbi:molybdopterin-synthase adenylyltransferase MoeB [Haliangium ochraceum]|uniref:Molybdopterin-synthase adenylyltransferase n=1 Tax=Haliangium ochraceum (strain DSM 14365 / JCM 11303 / SMP-2) TaxID=502025 RepID=D0LH09_HALO1|nr:molybdopterin-synthase adenylyltransferase MoeB [Haliangium ochraceum]ACY14731.1 UBA/THIF-type NAD/FAD binding protein [Haliangium ochraceum DSM 14365]